MEVVQVVMSINSNGTIKHIVGIYKYLNDAKETLTLFKESNILKSEYIIVEQELR